MSYLNLVKKLNTFITRRQLISTSFLLKNNVKEMSNTKSPKEVNHDEQKNEFVVGSGQHKAYLQYSVENGVYDLYHTFVPPELRGGGVARVLADAAFDHVLNVGGKMKLTCSYLDHVHKKNPDSKYASIVLSDLQ